MELISVCELVLCSFSDGCPERMNAVLRSAMVASRGLCFVRCFTGRKKAKKRWRRTCTSPPLPWPVCILGVNKRRKPCSFGLVSRQVWSIPSSEPNRKSLVASGPQSPVVFGRECGSVPSCSHPKIQEIGRLILYFSLSTSRCAFRNTGRVSLASLWHRRPCSVSSCHALPAFFCSPRCMFPCLCLISPPSKDAFNLEELSVLDALKDSSASPLRIRFAKVSRYQLPPVLLYVLRGKSFGL